MIVHKVFGLIRKMTPTTSSYLMKPAISVSVQSLSSGATKLNFRRSRILSVAAHNQYQIVGFKLSPTLMQRPFAIQVICRLTVLIKKKERKFHSSRSRITSFRCLYLKEQQNSMVRRREQKRDTVLHLIYLSFLLSCKARRRRSGGSRERK